MTNLKTFTKTEWDAILESRDERVRSDFTEVEAIEEMRLRQHAVDATKASMMIEGITLDDDDDFEKKWVSLEISSVQYKLHCTYFSNLSEHYHD